MSYQFTSFTLIFSALKFFFWWGPNSLSICFLVIYISICSFDFKHLDFRGEFSEFLLAERWLAGLLGRVGPVLKKISGLICFKLKCSRQVIQLFMHYNSLPSKYFRLSINLLASSYIHFAKRLHQKFMYISASLPQQKQPRFATSCVSELLLFSPDIF